MVWIRIFRDTEWLALFGDSCSIYRSLVTFSKVLPTLTFIKPIQTNLILNIAFKFPLCILPIINFGYTISQHIYKQHPNVLKYLMFLGVLNRTYTITFLSEFFEFLFHILISIQLFIYIRFDLKIKITFRRLLNIQSNNDHAS